MQIIRIYITFRFYIYIYLIRVYITRDAVTEDGDAEWPSVSDLSRDNNGITTYTLTVA